MLLQRQYGVTAVGLVVVLGAIGLALWDLREGREASLSGRLTPADDHVAAVEATSARGDRSIALEIPEHRMDEAGIGAGDSAVALGLPKTRPGETAFAAFHDWMGARSGGLAEARAGSVDRQGIALAAKRRDEMLDLIQGDPRRALELAIPDALRARLPREMVDLIEERVAGRGDLEVLCVLPEPGREGEGPPIRRYAVIGESRWEAHVYGRNLNEPTRRDVSLLGIALDGHVALADRLDHVLESTTANDLGVTLPDVTGAEGEDSGAEAISHLPSSNVQPGAVAMGSVLQAGGDTGRVQPVAGDGGGELGGGASLAAAVTTAAATEVRRRLLLIRVDFSDLVGDPFSETRAAALVRELHQFFQENSYGRAGWYEIGDGSEVTPVLRLPRTASYYGSRNDAFAMRSDARAAARAAGYVLGRFDYDVICLRNVPGFSWAGLGYVGSPGAWIRGTSSVGVTAHELGHNLGLQHANFWNTAGVSVTGAGTEVEYGDKFDTMGAANGGNYHFNARYKRLLGWLQPGEFSVATSNGTYRIHAHDQPAAVAGSRGLQVFANAFTNYWFEFRQRFTANPWLMNGVGVRWAGRGNEPSLLLDTSPGSAREKDDGAVVLGRTFSDRRAEIHVTPIAKGDSAPAWLDVVVQRGAFPGNRPPTVTLQPFPIAGPTTTVFEFRARGTDPDGDGLAYHWDFGDDTVGPNTNLVTHVWSSSGEYVVQVTATDMKGGEARASALVRVGAPSTFRIRGQVTLDGEPVVGARISAGQGRLAFTDSDGTYTLAGLNRASYTLTASTEDTRFQPLGFANPVQVQGNRDGLDFTVLESVQARRITLLPAGAQWRYWDRGTLPGVNWNRPDFDDRDWDVGAAILGYGGDRETTVIGFGGSASAKHITAWFRRTLVVSDPSRLSNLRLGLLRDDGAAVYLNGQEVVRDNLPAGTLTPQTRASSTVGGSAETTYFEFDLDPARLIAGTNLLAAEVHQVLPTSSDMAFDLRLTADESPRLERGVFLARPADGESFDAPARIVLRATVGDVGGEGIRDVVFLADGVPVGTASRAPYAVVWNHAPAGEHAVEVEARLAGGDVLRSTPIRIRVVSADLMPTLIARGSVWRYLDTGEPPDEGWREIEFHDRGWKQGPARLGYGEDGEFTVVDFGPDPNRKHVTTWFRRGFDVERAGGVSGLTLRLQRDDGAAVYLNGVELVRAGLRDGVITPTLLAQARIRDEAEQQSLEFNLPGTGLRDGRNVVAVEVHQVSRTDDDLGFDLELVGQRAASVPTPQLVARWTGDALAISWPAAFVGWTLESAASLGSEATWEVVAGSPVANGDTIEQQVPRTEGAAFFRLVSP